MSNGLKVRDFYLLLADELNEEARRDPRILSESQRVFMGLAAVIRRTVKTLDDQVIERRLDDQSAREMGQMGNFGGERNEE